MNNFMCCNNSADCDVSEANDGFSEVLSFLKIINEPNRLRILCLLKYGEQCVCDICEGLDLPQNLISHHLKTLKVFGLIDSRQEGRRFIYFTKPDVISKYALVLNNFLISNL